MLRAAGALLIVLAVSGCAGVPAAVVWTTVGSGFGFGAAVVAFDTEALKIWDERHPPAPPQ